MRKALPGKFSAVVPVQGGTGYQPVAAGNLPAASGSGRLVPSLPFKNGVWMCFTVLIFVLVTANLFADDGRQKIFAARAEAAFKLAQKQYQSDFDNPTAAWQFGRACYDWAGWATNKTRRAAIARAGIAACQQSLLFTNSVAAHYYLAMNLGQLASAEMLGALKLVRQMQREFMVAAGLNPHFDFAGPERGLGLLYLEAPGRPVSIGNRQKAGEYLEQAVALSPAYPENLLNLGEAYLKWNNRVLARKELDALDALWPQAQTNFIGQAWEQSWGDWSQRRDALRKKLGK